MNRTPFVLAVLSLALPAAGQISELEAGAASEDPKTYTIDETTIKIEEIGPASLPFGASALEADTSDVLPILDSIVNLGEKAWKIVVDNKPVADVRTRYASALPEGTVSWTRMQGWRKPKGTIYQLTARNLYGLEVVKLRYQVVRTSGGSYKGKGQFLTSVTIEPLLVEVGWGYRFSLAANVPDSSVVNVGTGEAPIAAMLARLEWHIATPIKESRGTGLYYLQGDGVYQEIGGPFKRGFAE